MRATTRLKAAAAATATAALLAGCTASANFTVSADALASEVATTLQNEVGSEQPPNIDCGEESISVVVGETVQCELTVPEDPGVWDTTVTITEVDGTEYAFDVQVAEQPR